MSSVLIVGGGITGLEAASRLAFLGKEVVLVEREEELGGNLRTLGSTFPEGRQASALIEKREQAIRSSAAVTVFTDTEITSLKGTCPRINASLKTPGGTREVVCSSVILATGFTAFHPVGMKHYGFGLHSDVITAVELAVKIKENKLVRNSNGQPPHAVTFVQCIGSRDLRTHTYCSTFCCMYAVHCALQVREQLPHCRVSVLYMDIRTPFRSELLYEDARRKGVSFFRSKPAGIRAGRGHDHLTIQYEDTLDNELRFLHTDMVVLSIGAEPPRDAGYLAASLGIETGESGFFSCATHPVMTAAQGVFVAGAASGPKDIASCMAEGAAAAAQAAMLLKE